jgi:PAS domain-containing protein
MAGAVGETRAALAAEAAGRTWAEVERSPAEAGLRQSEARFSALAETSPLAVAVTSPDEGTFLYADRAFQAIVGHDGDACSAARRSSRRGSPTRASGAKHAVASEPGSTARIVSGSVS